MSTMIVCPGCGTEVDYREVDKSDHGKCTICGKVLLAEVIKKKQDAKKSGEDKLQNQQKRGINSRKMGKKLQQLGDDDLFGDLEPFNIDDSPEEVEEEITSKTKAKVRKLSDDSSSSSSRPNIEDEELDDDEKFENPMAKSSLMKKLKDDQDLFGSLDG